MNYRFLFLFYPFDIFLQKYTFQGEQREWYKSQKAREVYRYLGIIFPYRFHKIYGESGHITNTFI